MDKFNEDDFLNIIIPVMFKQANGEYYVKGGRVYDVYFKDKTDSIDWDVTADETFSKDIGDKLQKYATKFNLVLLKNETAIDDLPMIQYGFQDIFFQVNDPYVIDVVIKDKKIQPTDYFVIEGVNYMSLENFMTDLLITQTNRSIQAREYHKHFVKARLPQYMHAYDIPEDIEVKSISKAVRNSVPYCMKKAEKTRFVDDYMKYLIMFIATELSKLNIAEDNSHEEQLNIFNTKLKELISYAEDEYEKKTDEWEEIDFFSDYDFFIDNVYNHLVSLEVGGKMFQKYKKTRKRYNNIINLSWDNLTNKFKRYLTEQCSLGKQNINLFNINSTCLAYVDCSENTIVKNTSNCIGDENLKLNNLDHTLD